MAHVLGVACKNVLKHMRRVSAIMIHSFITGVFKAKADDFPPKFGKPPVVLCEKGDFVEPCYHPILLACPTSTFNHSSLDPTPPSLVLTTNLAIGLFSVSFR